MLDRSNNDRVPTIKGILKPNRKRAPIVSSETEGTVEHGGCRKQLLFVACERPRLEPMCDPLSAGQFGDGFDVVFGCSDWNADVSSLVISHCLGCLVCLLPRWRLAARYSTSFPWIVSVSQPENASTNVSSFETFRYDVKPFEISNRFILAIVQYVAVYRRH